MGNNPSVKRFRTDMQDLAEQMKTSFEKSLLRQAAELAGNIQRAIPHSVRGHLRDSVRTKNVSTNTKPSVLVLAGGPKTTKRTSAGQAFDYALAEEFGTSKEEPRPFFYSTVRMYKNAFRDGAKETFEQAVAENNKIRQIRADNQGGAGQSASYRGAYTLRGT